MAKYQKFEDLPVWQEAARLYDQVSALIEKPNLRFTAGFRSQLERATLSVSNTIAHTFERGSNEDILALLATARISACEVRSMISVLRKRPGLDAWKNELDSITKTAESCGAQIGAWMARTRRGPEENRSQPGDQRTEPAEPRLQTSDNSPQSTKRPYSRPATGGSMVR
jgi:four helix bundle protein